MKGAPLAGRDGRGARVPEGAEAEHASFRRGLRPGRDSPRRLHDRRARSSPQRSRRRRRPSEGTHIYDALIKATESSRIRACGGRRSSCSRTEPTSAAKQASPRHSEALAATNARVYSVGLRSPQYAPESLQSVSRRSGGRYAEAAQPAELAAIFTEIGAELASEYEVTYRSLLPPQVEGRRPGRRGRPPRGEGELYDSARSRSPPAARSIVPGSTRVIVSPYLAVFIVVSVDRAPRAGALRRRRRA